jgi:hypothetical protein
MDIHVIVLLRVVSLTTEKRLFWQVFQLSVDDSNGCLSITSKCVEFCKSTFCIRRVFTAKCHKCAHIFLTMSLHLVFECCCLEDITPWPHVIVGWNPARMFIVRHSNCPENLTRVRKTSKSYVHFIISRHSFHYFVTITAHIQLTIKKCKREFSHLGGSSPWHSDDCAHFCTIKSLTLYQLS